MGGWSSGLVPVVLLASLTGTAAFSKNFVNSSLPDSKFTFVVNFDSSQVICQHSENASDLFIHEMSILCDGKQDCFTNPAIHDESFPYCEQKCLSNCNNRGACLFDGKQPQCFCNSGFSGPSCEFVDKNECLANPCHMMADCKNRPFGFDCECRSGFVGNGYNCADIDECSSENDCPLNSVCVNLPGTHYCNCTQGFAQKGDALITNCVDINECETGSHNCGKNQLCENTIGGFKCVSGCTDGYEYSNGECIDIDECKKEEICHPRAECFNSPGNYSCICEEGMEGDGKFCQPKTDCTQREDICDRHAQCIHPLKMCQCMAGFAGDGISCHDVDECQAMSEPCKQQKGKRCVNIVGGFICCDKGSDDERCIEEKGAFCAGGCGLNAYCGNRTCECLPGYSGDPFKKCLDVNECDMDSMCSGVGEWCVNVFGSFLCCKPDSTEPECQGVHIFRNSDGSTAILHTNHTKDVVVSGEQGEHGITHQGGFIAVGKGVLRANGSLPSISALSKRACTSYCPINSECVNGYCECSKGFGGNPHLGCEDLNECIATKPCGEETKDNWCVNTEGSFTCCTSNSTESECLGLEIVPEEGMRIFGGRSSLDGEQLIAQSVNETVSQEVVSHRIQEFQNSSQGGAVLLVRNAVPTDIAILKPEKGEMGLEITGEQVRKESIGSESTTQTPGETVTLPGIISTLGGLSTSTTAIPVTEVPIHIPGEKKTLVPNSNETTTVLIDASTLKSITELEGSGSEISKIPSVEDGDMLPGGSTTESSQTSSGHINVRFTTLEELNKNATKTTVGPNTVIDGDGRGEESTVDDKGGKKPTNVIDGDGTGDVNVVDTRVRTTKAPTLEEKLKEPNPDKEGLEIVAKATKPITDVTTPKPDAAKTIEGTTQKTTSIPAEKLTEQPTEATKGEATSKPTEGETSTIGKGKLPEGTTSAGKETTVKTSTISSSVEETTPSSTEKTTSTNSITGPDSTSSSKTNVEGTSGKSGNDKPDLAEDSREKEGEEKNDKKPTKTVISDREEPGKGKHLTELSSGEQKAPETDRHGGDSEDSAQGEVGTYPPTTTEATTGETGLEIVHRGTALPDATTTSSGMEGTTKSSVETSSSSSGGSILVAKEKKNDSGSKRPETDITDGENTESLESQSGIPKTTAEPTTDGVGLEIKWEGTTLSSSSLPTKPSTIETATGSTAGLSEKSTKATSVGSTASTETSLGTSEPTTGSSKAPESETTSVGTTREGHINISIGPTAEPTEATTESGTAETGLEIIHEATKAGTSEATTPSSTQGTSTEKPTESTVRLSSEKVTEATFTTVSTEASSLGTSEPTVSSTSLSSSALTDSTSTNPETTTSEVGLEIVGATTPSSSSVSPEDKTETPTTQPAKEDITTGIPTTTELGLEIVPDKATTKAAEETTTGQPDLVLTGAPSSSVEPSSSTSSSTEAPVTAAGRIENVTRSTEVTTAQPDLVLTVSSTAETSTTEKVTTTESTVKPTEEITAAPTLSTDGTTKIPKTTVEVVTAGPDEDLTGAPTKQNRLIPTDLPSEPEVTTKETFSLPEKATPSPVTLGPNNVTKCVSSDECGDDALCERRTGACRCLPGFQGIPPATPCTDVDECAEGLHKCHESARCHNIVGTYACFCPMGYRKNELGVCIDIDECSESRGNCCSLNGTCVNKPGSYGCECKPGFFGDGYKCMPMEKRTCTESELAKAGCGQHHVCMVDGLGAVDCNTCKMGFKMVEGKCSDVNECTEPGLNMCSPSANCNNLLGTYACSCKEGFKGDGYMCEDVDECSNSPCHPQAECENLLGSFKCTCPSGFTGDGIKDCMNPMERSCEDVAGFCGRVEHTACLSVRIFNGSLSSVCECEPGFRFNKQLNKCDDINECEENRHNCDPASSVCVNEAGGFHCNCAEGYEGVGGICVDVNECERGTAGCHSMAMCLNQPGSCGCKCMQGFTGDGIQCNPLQKREEENACTAEWDRLCLLENKTCHVDEEDVPQCGSCIEGHHPIKGSCQPVHGAGTCADPNKNSCDKNAECIDIPGTPGKHFCTCKKGFIGDGIRCDDIDECSLTGICHLHATCQNLPGSFNCTCNPGFTGNGFTCTKTAGPNCHLNEELCHKNAECTMDGQCKCKKGFEGDGFKECTEVSGTTTQREETATAAPPSMTPPNFETSEIVPTTEPEMYGSTTQESTESTTVLTAAPSIVTDDGVEVHTETNGPKPVGSQRQEKGKCSADDRSKCHEFAICDLSTKSCRCKDGFKGDGFTSCTQVISVDCVSNSSLCHSDAFCDRHTRKCACNSGYIGDGILCSPDPQDCILRKDLCSLDAICSGRRCHCVAGFTGDGVKCVSLHQRSANCSECDINAHCSQGVCSCNIGYFGNGLCCVPDPRDCIHFPGVCHPEASCNKESRQCSCKRGYLGDGISCFPAVSCVTDPSVCNKNAVCLPSGHCMCRNGYEGNGHNCQLLSSAGINAIREMARDTPSLCGNKCNRESELCIEGQCICKHGYKKVNDVCQDIDECAKSPCHSLAACHNTKGSFSCTCPEGYVGDGRTCVQHLKIGELGVFCENDGMTLVLSNETQLFEGKMYVRGQAENPNCIKTFSPLQQQPRPYTFKVFFEHCNVQLLENNTFATTVIVQKHPHFITTSADSYDLKCTYSPGISQVQSHVNVSELAPTSTLSNKFDGPTCSLKITDDHDDFVESAKVGQSMVLRLEVSPNGTYGILPRDCVAVNIETGERYQLTDKYGCAVDDQLFPEFTQIHPSVTQAVFRTFKWPDSSMIRFQCDCNACVGPCPMPDCHHKRTLPRFRRAHHGAKEIDQEIENLNLVETNRKAFSRLLTVHEDVQEQLAQEEIEQWHRRKSHLTESLPAISEVESEGVCVRTAILAGAALLLVLSLGFLTTTFLQRRSTIPKSPDSPISVISL